MMATEMVKAYTIDGPVSCWWVRVLGACNEKPNKQTNRSPHHHAALPPIPPPLRSVPGRLRRRRPTPSRRGKTLGRADRAFDRGDPRTGSARQHVTLPHTRAARDPRASLRPGPSLSTQSVIHLYFTPPWSGTSPSHIWMRPNLRTFNFGWQSCQIAIFCCPLHPDILFLYIFL